MSQETMDNIFHANGFADAVMADIRRGITFSTGHGLSFERLIDSLKADHSLEEIDNYDALLGLYQIFMTMATPMARHQVRSEEHTSELQSLMRISYAVFCLKQKTSTQ